MWNHEAHNMLCCDMLRTRVSPFLASARQSHHRRVPSAAPAATTVPPPPPLSAALLTQHSRALPVAIESTIEPVVVSQRFSVLSIAEDMRVCAPAHASPVTACAAQQVTRHTRLSNYKRII